MAKWICSTGGGVWTRSGYGSATSSGALSIVTSNAGTNGVSGVLSLSTGAGTVDQVVVDLDLAVSSLMERVAILVAVQLMERVAILA